MAQNKIYRQAVVLILILLACILFSQIAIAQEVQKTKEDSANGSTIIISEEKELSRLSPAYVNELKEKRQLITNLILIAAALLLIYLIYKYKIEPHLGHKEHVKGHSEFFGR